MAGPPHDPPGDAWQRVTGTTHLLVVAGVGALTGVAVGLVADPRTGALAAWVVASSTFLIWTWTSVWPLDAAQTAAVARREDPSRQVRDGVLVLLAVASLLIVGLVLFRAHDNGPTRVILGVAGVVASWLVLHSVYVLRYARLYYAEPVGGIDFKQAEHPTYRDFAYVSFTVGMAFQVSDTDIGQGDIRTTVLQHALLSFVFVAVILAGTINLLAGLGS